MGRLGIRPNSPRGERQEEREMKTTSINLTPSWESTGRMLLMLIESSETEEGRQYAKGEIIRMGKIIDQQQATLESYENGK